jgi:hypothetical protein
MKSRHSMRKPTLPTDSAKLAKIRRRSEAGRETNMRKQKRNAEQRSAAATANGSEGGLARAEYYGPEVLSEWAAAGGQAVLNKYGREHFVRLRKRRKHYRKQDAPPLDVIRPAVVSGRQNGVRGGLARAELYGPEKLSEWARRGGIATRKRYGSDYYRRIRKLRKSYRKGYQTQKTRERQRETMQHLAATEPNPEIAALWKFVATH